MSKVKQIIRLRENGTGLQTIAKSLGIARNSVKKYLRLIQVKGYSYQELLEREDHEVEALLSDPDYKSQSRYEALEGMFPHIEQELKRTGVTRWILWGEYKEKHPDGYSYAHFCHYLRAWLDKQGATMHFDHSPGDKVFIDFAGKKLNWVERDTGLVHEAEVYAAILGYSQLTYVEAIPSQQKADYIGASENALHYFGGVSRALVPDNLKSAVYKASKYEAELNSDFADFANHYNTTVLPARGYKPRDKALVENVVNIMYSRIYAPLRDRVFYSLQELNQAIRELLEKHNNQPFQQYERSRREVFDQEEKAQLLPLAAERYHLKYFTYRTVMKNAHIQLSKDKHYYSVPYRYIGKKVKVVYSKSQVAVYYNKERIAFHQRDFKRFEYTTCKEHLPSAHQFVSDWNPDKFLNWAAGIDPKVKEYITMILESRPHPEQAYKSCLGILTKEKKVGRRRLINAIDRAIHYGVYNYTIIDRILKGGLDRIQEEGTNEDQSRLPTHENIRGAEDYK